MGICTSCYSGATATTTTATGKLVLLDGQLREFPSPVKTFLISPPPASSSFICNADEIDFDSYVTAMAEDEELRPGQLYFELPVSWLHRRLTAEDMASLAVKAGTALVIGGGGGGGGGKGVGLCGCWVRTRVDVLVFCDDDDGGGGGEMTSAEWNRAGGGGGGGGGRSYRGGGHRGSGGKERTYFTRLERIVE